jgi:hypothetical protein
MAAFTGVARYSVPSRSTSQASWSMSQSLS